MWRFRPTGGIGFGPFLARLAVPLRFAVLKPRLWGLVFGASSAQLRPAQAVVWALPKLCQWLFLDSDVAFSAPGGIGFGAFLARLGPPCRCASLSWSLGSGALFLVPSPSSSQPSPAQPRPAQALVWALPRLFLNFS